MTASELSWQRIRWMVNRWYALQEPQLWKLCEQILPLLGRYLAEKRNGAAVPSAETPGRRRRNTSTANGASAAD